MAPTTVGPVHQDRAYLPHASPGWGAEAADALDHAHGLGILHRDIKPANLLIDRHGAVWITDFGLARFPSDLSLTGTGDVVGTLRYMSPEQALARRGVVDQRTDVYALGATLYELLTLRPAFDGRDHQELLRQIALDEPIRPRRLNPAIPRDLETIVLKAMAKDPSQPLRDGPGAGRRPGAVPGRPADPGSPPGAARTRREANSEALETSGDRGGHHRHLLDRRHDRHLGRGAQDRGCPR